LDHTYILSSVPRTPTDVRTSSHRAGCGTTGFVRFAGSRHHWLTVGRSLNRARFGGTGIPGVQKNGGHFRVVLSSSHGVQRIDRSRPRFGLVAADLALKTEHALGPTTTVNIQTDEQCPSTLRERTSVVVAQAHLSPVRPSPNHNTSPATTGGHRESLDYGIQCCEFWDVLAELCYCQQHQRIAANRRCV